MTGTYSAQQPDYAELAEAAARGEFHRGANSKTLTGAAARAFSRALLLEATEDDPEERARVLRALTPQEAHA